MRFPVKEARKSWELIAGRGDDEAQATVEKPWMEDAHWAKPQAGTGRNQDKREVACAIASRTGREQPPKSHWNLDHSPIMPGCQTWSLEFVVGPAGCGLCLVWSVLLYLQSLSLMEWEWFFYAIMYWKYSTLLFYAIYGFFLEFCTQVLHLHPFHPAFSTRTSPMSPQLPFKFMTYSFDYYCFTCIVTHVLYIYIHTHIHTHMHTLMSPFTVACIHLCLGLR